MPDSCSKEGMPSLNITYKRGKKLIQLLGNKLKGATRNMERGLGQGPVGTRQGGMALT